MSGLSLPSCESLRGLVSVPNRSLRGASAAQQCMPRRPAMAARFPSPFTLCWCRKSCFMFPISDLRALSELYGSKANTHFPTLSELTNNSACSSNQSSTLESSSLSPLDLTLSGFRPSVAAQSDSDLSAIVWVPCRSLDLDLRRRLPDLAATFRRTADKGEVVELMG